MKTDTGRELSIIEGETRELSETVALPVSVDLAIEQWNQYQQLTRRLLDDTDYQKIGTRSFKKKSAWRKYARAFNISDRVTHEEIVRADDGFPIYARIRVTAYHPGTGREAEADHECHILERCCPKRNGDYCEKVRWQSHRCCTADCNGRKHWSHPGDLPATATTRAKNRAISDLIGAGEVSAEEMTEETLKQNEQEPSNAQQPKPQPVTPTGSGKVELVKVEGDPDNVCWMHNSDWEDGDYGASHPVEGGGFCNRSKVIAGYWKQVSGAEAKQNWRDRAKFMKEQLNITDKWGDLSVAMQLGIIGAYRNWVNGVTPEPSQESESGADEQEPGDTQPSPEETAEQPAMASQPYCECEEDKQNWFYDADVLMCGTCAHRVDPEVTN